MSRSKPLGSVQRIGTTLEVNGYTKDAVIVECANPRCDHKVTCKYTRRTEGRNVGQPLIQIPEDWKVCYTYGDTKQDVLCPTCGVSDLPGGSLFQ